jgi:cytochrome c553
MKRRWFKIAGALLALAAGGFLLAAAGLMPIKASSGHWPITSWLLKFTMRRSVATHSLALKPPKFDTPDLVLQGAGHYETGCRPCHGSPEVPLPRVPQHMTPHPPNLLPVIAELKPDELFYVVKHGVKFTGMPAWPTQQRDDEVWAMVAFLLDFPKLDVASYRQLIFGENPAAVEVVSLQALSPVIHASETAALHCDRCHGRGEGVFPRLGGQRSAYLFAALQAYARGDRHSGIMSPIAAAMRPNDMQQLADYYSYLEAPAPPSPTSSEASSIARGKTIAHDGIPGRRVPSCVDCHGPSAAPRNPVFPILAGQYADYLELQLKLFHSQRRGGSAYGHLMHPVAAWLTPADMHDVALYYASLTTASDHLRP